MTKRIGDVIAAETALREIGIFAEDIRQFAPKDWMQQLDDAFTDLLPTKGQVRSPNGLVHAIIGDHTYCDIQWAAHSRKEGRSLRVMGWEPVDVPVTCLACVVEG